MYKAGARTKGTKRVTYTSAASGQAASEHQKGARNKLVSEPTDGWKQLYVTGTKREVRGSRRHFFGEILQTLDIVLCIQPGEFWTIVAPRSQSKSGEENRTVGAGISEV